MNGPLNIFQWYNIIFLGPAFLGGFWFFYTIVTGVGHDMDADADCDHEADYDHVEHGNDHDVESDHSTSGTSGIGMRDILNLKNRCPKLLAFSILFLTWGALGYVINSAIVSLPAALFLPAWACNVVIVSFIAIMVVRIAAPMISNSLPPANYNYPTTANIIGKKGKVSTLMSVEHGGSIVIDVGGGAPLIKRAVLIEGYEGPTLERNTEVLIMGLKGDILICTPVV